MNQLRHFIKTDNKSKNLKIGDSVIINPRDKKDVPRHKGRKGVVYKEYPGDPDRVYVRIDGTGFAYDKDDLDKEE